MHAVVQPSPALDARMTTRAVTRNLAVDAYRGLVMVLMMAEVLQLPRVAQAFPGNWFWQTLAFNQSHVPWAGCSLHDTIQPGFSFRSEEHTSELQSHHDLVCRLLLEKKKQRKILASFFTNTQTY